MPRPAATRAGREIIESILAAAEAVITDHGLAAFTTNRVSARAGVSVGSLYQYFPNKQAILAALARRLERRTEAQLLDAIAASTDAPLAVVVARVVDVLVAGIGSARLRAALREVVPSGWALDTSAEVDAAVRTRLGDELARRRDVRAGDHAVMAWVIAHAIEGAVEAIVVADPGALASAELRGELCALAVNYLRRRRPRVVGRRRLPPRRDR